MLIMQILPTRPPRHYFSCLRLRVLVEVSTFSVMHEFEISSAVEHLHMVGCLAMSIVLIVAGVFVVFFFGR